ncbi:MAG TPA: pentapeptide repeat-containing protein, partial [Ktedonobacterales bacterium]|nr:pentapeptide repeat-containing protein [Ktedonobacterales bacterium]
MAGTPRKSQNSIKAPQLPKTLTLADPDEDMLVDKETYTQLEFQQRDLTGGSAYRLHYEEVVFTQVNLTAAFLDYVRMEDVRLVGCNLANATWTHLSCVRAEFIGCRLTGCMMPEAL